MKLRQVPMARKIANIFSIAIVLFAVVFSIIIFSVLKRRAIDEKYQKIEAAGKELASILHFTETNDTLENQASLINFRIQEKHIPYYILYTIYQDIDGQQKTLLTNDPFIPICKDPAGSSQTFSFFYDKEFYTDGPIHIIYTTTTAGIYKIQTAMDMEQDAGSSVFKELPFIIIMITIPLVAASNFAAKLISKRLMKSLNIIINTANNISASNLTQRIEESGPNDEIRQLAAAFNRLFSRLQTEFERERQFTSDVSHELRTPISVILGHTALLQRWGKTDAKQLDTSLATIQKEALNMQDLTENLLQLARSESGRIPIRYSFIRIDRIFDTVINEFAVTNPDAKITGEARPDDVIYFDESILTQCLKIIITNSIRYSPQQAVIALHFSFTSSGIAERSGWQIKVTDRGSGILPKDLPLIFNRLYRGDESRTRQNLPPKSGNGLGLSIARALLKNLQATLTAESPAFDDPATPGTTMTITGKMIQIKDE